MRKLWFLFGLNTWGLGVALAAKALDHQNLVGWLVPGVLLFGGTLLLSAALLPARAAH